MSRKNSDTLGSAELGQLVVDVINGDPLVAKAAPFPAKYYVTEDIAGQREILKEAGDGGLVKSSLDSVQANVYNYCRTIADIAGPVSANQVKGMAELWKIAANPIPMPAYILDKSDKGRCFARLPFDTALDTYPDGTPIPPAQDFPECFQSILDRCSQPRALCAFIGSIFYPQADCQQYLYMKGEGGDSKGTIINFLTRLMKQTLVSTSPPGRSGEDKFYCSTFFGKRLAVMPDCNNVGFFGSGLFKSLTGGDPVSIERKYQNSFTANLECKFLVASNYAPTIDGQDANVRRIIYVTFESVPEADRDPRFVDVLMNAAKEIVTGCKYVYLEMTKGRHGPIPCAPPDDVLDDNEERYIDIFERNFIATSLNNVTDVTDGTPSSLVIQCLLAEKITSNSEISKVKRVWNRRFKVDQKIVREGGRVFKVYTGMRPRSGMNGSHLRGLGAKLIDFPVTNETDV